MYTVTASGSADSGSDSVMPVSLRVSSVRAARAQDSDSELSERLRRRAARRRDSDSEADSEHHLISD
jgi:hypothetical protein